MNLLADEAMVDFCVLANGVNGLTDIAICTFLDSLRLACLVLIRTIT